MLTVVNREPKGMQPWPLEGSVTTA
jgi:hypothetical protein